MKSLRKLVIFLLAFAVCSHSCDALRILGIFPLAMKSHFVMAEELMKVLAQKGHEVDVVSHFPQKKLLPNYTDFSLAGSMPTTMNNITISTTQEAARILALGGLIEFAGIIPCNLLSHSELQKILQKPKNSYDVVIVEFFAAHCFLAFGQHFNAPVVAITTSSLHDWLYAPFVSPFNPAYMPSVESNFGQEMNFFERIKNTFYYNFISLQFNYFIENEREQVEKYFGRKLSSMQELYDDVALVLVNSHYSINMIKPSTPDIIEVGGLHISKAGQELSSDLQKWLDESSEGCVYISYGSMVKIETLPRDKLDAFYEMFKKISPIRVLIKIADPTLLPPNLPKNVKISSWLPQIAVLEHRNVKAFITHGGLMGTQESIALGVPLVGMPLFADQHMNIRTYARQKIAVELDINTFDAESLTNAVETVINDPVYRKNIKELSDVFMDRLMSPKETAIYWVEYTARHGNRLKSPARKLTWWQYYLLDVYGFILGSVLFTLYIVTKLLGFVYSFFCRRKSIKITTKPLLKSKKRK